MLNPHVFRLVPHPGPAPELAARSGQGNWEPYALAAPADRLLPFVLSRARSARNSRWLNCATLVHADTEQVLFTLTPTGQTFAGPGPLGLVLDKVVDAQNGLEHFLYYGVLIPGLALPCGVPLRLLLDNAWQSPRFEAYANLAGFQGLEWSHPGPLSGVPYGTGLTQRFFQPNGGLQYAAPREVKVSTQDAASGAVRLDYLAKYRTATATAGPVPAFLSEALTAAESHKSFAVDGEAWRVTAVKEAAAGPDGGRWLMSLSLEQKQVLQARLSCPPAPLAPAAFDPLADRPRAYRCGESGDTDPDFLPTGRSACELDADGLRTGYLLAETRDNNPFSRTYGSLGSSRTYDEAACPLPPVFRSKYYAEEASKDDCPNGLPGTAVLFEVAAGAYSSRKSQDEADQQAMDFVRAGKQAYANLYGTCAPAGGDYFPRYLDNGCFSGFMVSRSSAADVRAATEAEYARYMRGLHGSDGAECPLYN